MKQLSSCPHCGADLRDNSFTPREVEIGRLLVTGATNKEIAKELRIRERTVKARMSAMFRKRNLVNGHPRVRLAVMLSKEKEFQ